MICRPARADKAVWDEVRGWSASTAAHLWWLNGGGLVPALVPWPAGLGGRLLLRGRGSPPVGCGREPSWRVRARGLRLEVRQAELLMMPSAFLKWSEALGAPVRSARSAGCSAGCHAPSAHCTARRSEAQPGRAISSSDANRASVRQRPDVGEAFCTFVHIQNRFRCWAGTSALAGRHILRAHRTGDGTAHNDGTAC
jgi:hypothetical protein